MSSTAVTPARGVARRGRSTTTRPSPIHAESIETCECRRTMSQQKEGDARTQVAPAESRSAQDVVEADRAYTYRLGALHAILNSLELSLRIALYFMDTPREQRLPPDFRIAGLKVGDRLPKSSLTKHAFLSEFVDEYNKRQTAAGLATVDIDIVDLRNELAHGLISATSPGDPTFTLIRLGKAQDGMVPVIARSEMTFDWLGDQCGHLNAVLGQVNARLHELK
jgi:hypothetical protein